MGNSLIVAGHSPRVIRSVKEMGLSVVVNFASNRSGFRPAHCVTFGVASSHTGSGVASVSPPRAFIVEMTALFSHHSSQRAVDASE
jgi:hypothetical protein